MTFESGYELSFWVLTVLSVGVAALTPYTALFLGLGAVCALTALVQRHYIGDSIPSQPDRRA